MHKLMNKKEIKEFNIKLKEEFGLENFFDKREQILLDGEVYRKDKGIVFFHLNERLMPSLKLVLKNNFLKTVTVDMGAVKFVVSGADIMRPGITKMDEGICKGQLVVVVDETHAKPLAIGEMMFDREEAMAMSSGKVVKNLHYVGDKVWSS